MKYNNSLKENKKEFDFLKFFKPCLIASLIIILVAGLFWGIFGFNKGYEFTGGTQLVVEFYDDSLQTQEGTDKASNEIKKILNDNGLKINTLQVQGRYYDKCFVITLQEKNKLKINAVRLEINKKLNTSEHFEELVSLGQEYKILEDESYTGYDITKKSSTIDGLISPVAVISTLSTMIFALILVMIYTLFRLKSVANALTFVFSGLLNVILATSFVLLARIEINSYFFVLLALILLVSVYATADFVFTTKATLKEPALSDKTNYDIANIVVKNNLKRNIIVYSIAVGISLIFGIVGVQNIFYVGLTSFVGIACVFATHLFVIPAFWALINKKRELTKPVFTTTNDADADAEVIEIAEEETANEEKPVEEND